MEQVGMVLLEAALQEEVPAYKIPPLLGQHEEALMGVQLPARVHQPQIVRLEESVAHLFLVPL